MQGIVTSSILQVSFLMDTKTKSQSLLCQDGVVEELHWEILVVLFDIVNKKVLSPSLPMPP